MPKIELEKQIIEYKISYRGKKYIKAKIVNRQLIVTAPPRTQPYYIEELLKANSKKIINALYPKEKVEKAPKEPKPVKERPIKPIKERKPDYVHFQNKEYLVYYVVANNNSCTVNHSDIVITAKKDDRKLFRKVLYTYFKEVVEKEIRRLLPQAYKDFAEIKMPVINVKDYKSNRLGVCRKIDDTYVVSLSAKLAKYELKFIKVVLYHELSHILEMNHSAAFYRVFEQKLPNAKLMQKALRSIKYRDCI